jgi:hypothetical protein
LERVFILAKKLGAGGPKSQQEPPSGLAISVAEGDHRGVFPVGAMELEIMSG